MRPPEFYRGGREQTYAKHFFLERYLERVAWNIFSFRDDFVYVDGFSGPWQSADERYEDTSFVIALNQLRKVRNSYRTDRNKDIRVRCLFNDSDPHAYENLKSYMDKVDDIEVHTVCREFEALVPDIVRFVGSSFSLTFIDPKGWTGFGLQEIHPLLQLRGEVIVNFMFDFVNRFFDDPRPEIIASFDPLFGSPGWYPEVEERIARGETRESAIVAVYSNRLKNFGKFQHVTSTRILKPVSDRSYFHLVYGTGHLKGLREFRTVERKAVDAQELERNVAKITRRIERSGQGEFFAVGETQTGPSASEIERKIQLDGAFTDLQNLLKSQGAVQYDSILGRLLERPLVWESDITAWLVEMHTNGEVEIPQLAPRAKIPKLGYTIVWKGVAS